jgi:hypothetical protein
MCHWRGVALSTFCTDSANSRACLSRSDGSAAIFHHDPHIVEVYWVEVAP